MARKFFVIRDRITGRVYEHSNPKRNLLIRFELPEMRSNGEFEIIIHDLVQAGFNVFMPEDTNSFCYLQQLGRFIPAPWQIDMLNRVSKKWEVLYPETLRIMGYDFVP